MKKFSATIAICGLLFAVNMATAGHGNSTLAATYPFGGGPITLMAVGGDVHSTELIFTSASGNLVPGPAEDTNGYTFYLSNTPNQIILGNLGTTVIYADGTSTLLALAPVITTSYGHGALNLDGR